MNSLRISVAFLKAATNKAQLGEVVVVHKDRAPAICRDLFKRPHICFEQTSTYSPRRSELDQTFPRTKLINPQVQLDKMYICNI